MTDKILNIGILGAGYIADWHAKALRQMDGVRIAAVCDASRGRAEAFARAWGVEGVYASLDAMLSEAKLDAVHVLLPPQHHAAAARQVLGAGVHVLLEKPMAPAPDDCAMLIALAAERGLRLGVSHNFCFAKPYEQLRNDVKSGRLGRIDHVAINWYKELSFIRSGPFDHWAVREPGNAILEVGTHSLAHLIDLVGAPAPEHVTVSPSRPATLPTGAVAYRHWHVHALRDDTVVDLNISLSPGYTEHAIHVRGSLGSATCDFESDTYTLRRHTRYATDIDRFLTVSRTGVATARQASRNFSNYVLSKAKLSTEGNAFATSIRRSLESFFAAVREHGPIDARISGETGLSVVQLAQRIGEAAPKVVSVPPRSAPKPLRPEILVTGGTGFIGRELVRQLLAQGKSVRVITRRAEAMPFEADPNLEVMAGNILADADQERALDGVRFVYHLARGSGKTYDEYLRDDIDPTRRLAEKSVARGVERFVYTSSIVVFNWADNAEGIRDDSPVDKAVHRRAAYTRAKAEAERTLLRLHKDDGLPLVIFRPGIVVGAGGDPCHWGVGMWQTPGVCQVWGEGDNTLPFVLVQDVAKALVLALDNGKAVGGTFNLVDAPMLSAKQYLAEFERAGGLELQKLYTPTWRFFAADCLKYAVKVAVRHPNRAQPSWRDWNARRELRPYDTSLTRSVLGWQPAGNRDTLIEQGVHAAVRVTMT